MILIGQGSTIGGTLLEPDWRSSTGLVQRESPAAERIHRPPAPEPIARPIEIEWQARPQDIARFRDPWVTLESSVTDRTVFGGADYLIPWYLNHGISRGKPLLGLAWSGNQLLGVAPLIVWNGTLGRMPVRRIDLAAHDVDAGEVLIQDGMPELLETFLSSLVDTASFDVLCVGGMRPGSERLSVLRRWAASQGFRTERADYRYALADVASGFDAYARCKGSNFRRNLKRHAARISMAGRCEIEVFSGDRDAARTEHFLQRMLGLLEKSWLTEPGGRLPEMHRGFYSDLIRRFGRRGMVDLSFLTIDGKDAAFVLGLIERGIHYDVTIEYDSAFAAYSPGTHLRHEVTRRLAENGVRTVFSHGDYEYKERWATEFASLCRIFIFSPTLRGAASRIARFTLPRVVTRIRRNGGRAFRPSL